MHPLDGASPSAVSERFNPQGRPLSLLHTIQDMRAYLLCRNSSMGDYD